MNELNPYKITRQKLNLTQAELASIAGVTRQVVTRTEGFMYHQPPPALTETLVKAQVRAYGGSQIDADGWDLVRGYRHGQVRTRLANKDAFKLEQWVWDGIKIWNQYRFMVHTSQYGFCNLLAFDISMLQFYEKDRTCRDELYEAMTDVVDEKLLGKIL